MKIRPSVAIFRDNKILLMHYVYGGQDVYNLPGGNAEELESIEETVKRELVEELNLEVETKKLKGEPTINPENTTSLGIVWKGIDELTEINMYPNVGKLLFEANSQVYIGDLNQKWF